MYRVRVWGHILVTLTVYPSVISLLSDCLDSPFFIPAYRSFVSVFSAICRYMNNEFNRQGARWYARKFYSSKAWEKRSKTYRQSHPLCERCLKKGRYEPSTCVHHVIHINKQNYKDPKILFNDSNLEALCDKCHYEEHHGNGTSFTFAPDGTLMDDYESEDI